MNAPAAVLEAAAAAAATMGATTSQGARVHPVSGGCINHAARIEIGGATFFAKWNDLALPRQFEAEARGLDAMRASGTSLAVPRPIAYGDGGPGRAFLLLEDLGEGRRAPGFDAAFGRGLAELHRASASAGARGYGFDLDGTCGATPQPNGWMPRWIDFLRERRLGHQLALARRNGIDRATAAAIERLLDRLDEWIGDDGEPPALVHGDLWAGNLHVAGDGRPALIDPAAHLAHREFEFGMMTAMGGFGPAVYTAYDEVWRLRADWRERNGIYQLYHLLNHFNLFGGSYAVQAAAVARRYVG